VERRCQNRNHSLRGKTSALGNVETIVFYFSEEWKKKKKTNRNRDFLPES
jgi:hypothetical protein